MVELQARSGNREVLRGALASEPECPRVGTCRLGGDSNFYKLSGKARLYYTLSDEMDLVGSVSGAAGHVISTNGGRLNVFDQFSIDSNDIRGFADTGIGPRMNKHDDPLGGTTYFTASAEVTFPLPGVSQDAGFRGRFFADAGTLYGNEVKIKPVKGEKLLGEDMSIRASLGASLIWASPFGPLRFDYAVPLTKGQFDRVQQFKFGGGTSF